MSSTVWLRGVALVVVALAVRLGLLWGLDQWAAAAIAGLRSPAVDGAVRAVTWLGDPRVTALVVTACALALWRRRETTAAKALTAAFVSGVVGEILLRLWVSQWRPDTTLLPISPDPWVRFRLTGFPSGHGYHSAFLFGWLTSRLRARWARPACLILIVLIGLTRLYVNRHWLSDILGAWLLAWTVLGLGSWLRGQRSEVGRQIGTSKT